MLERMVARRIVARPEALDAAAFPGDILALRIAADELLLLPDAELSVDDPHAISLQESGFVGAWLEAEVALGFLEQTCTWQLPSERPAFGQGAVAALPVKLYFEESRILFLTPAPYAADFEERFEAAR